MTPDVPAFRFPYYHFCPDPNCGRLMPYWGFGDVTDRSCANGHPKRNIVPSRFIAACTNGHLEDFPYEWWVHYGNFSECPADKRNGALRISFSDETGGLDSIVIKCTACGKSRTMAGSMAKDALRGYSCHGKRPWLGSKKEYNDPVSCTAQLRVLQRGASNVYFSMTASALTIPPWSSKVQQEIAVRWEQIEDILDSNPDEYVLRAVVQSVFHSLLEMQICTIDELISEIKKRYNDGNGGEYTKQNLLEDEYRVFCMGDYDDPEDVQFRIARATVPEFLEDYIEDIVLAKRLREVLALRGFRRITPEQPNADDDRFKGYHLSGDCVPLSDVELNWLPAIEMLGEGLFIKIREDALEEWEDAFENEYQPMRTRLEHSNVGCENFSARYVLLAFLSVVVVFPIPIIFSLFLNEVRTKWVRNTVQSLSFLPYFISAAVMVSIMYTLLSPTSGLINILITKLGGTSTNFMAKPEWFRPLYVILEIWQTFGYSAIIYIAAMMNIDPTLYEAAEIDGASRWTKMWRITLPCISTSVITMLIISVGNIFSVNLDRILLMYNTGTYVTADVIQTYVYRIAFQSTGFPDYSYGTAVNVLKSIIAFVLVSIVNKIADKVSDARLF